MEGRSSDDDVTEQWCWKHRAVTMEGRSSDDEVTEQWCWKDKSVAMEERSRYGGARPKKQ